MYPQVNQALEPSTLFNPLPYTPFSFPFSPCPSPSSPQAREWETSMMHAGCENPTGCLLAMCCPPCFAYHLRKKALNNDMTKYK